ncbi:hypothetical protein [Leclercia sp. Marseille-Q4284]|uniref:hypothetical protein n=1 Tax=Leclercia sp. Marseille-Q4284 TaxID=2866582 RepID=UPI001CE41A80|nr:hypothetical protein [Leclercia sp. Marseille-Q4284]
MADWFIATEGVKVVKDSVSLLPQIITAVSSAGAALGGVCLTHHFTRRREQRSSAAKLQNERVFIATELVFQLEIIAHECARIADSSSYGLKRGECSGEKYSAEINLERVTGDWRSLPPRIMYGIHEIPCMLRKCQRYLERLMSCDRPEEERDIFHQVIYEYTRVGLKALFLAMRLRRLAALPETRLTGYMSAQYVMKRIWRNERLRRKALYRKNRPEITAFQQRMHRNSEPFKVNQASTDLSNGEPKNSP